MEPKPLIGLLVVILTLALYLKLKQDYPDPYAVCDNKPLGAERDQCRSMVDFAMSAGW